MKGAVSLLTEEENVVFSLLFSRLIWDFFPAYLPVCSMIAFDLCFLIFSNLIHLMSQVYFILHRRHIKTSKPFMCARYSNLKPRITAGLLFRVITANPLPLVPTTCVGPSVHWVSQYLQCALRYELACPFLSLVWKFCLCLVRLFCLFSIALVWY